MKIILVMLLLMAATSCKSPKENLRDGLVVVATASAVTLCDAQDSVEVRKSFHTWISASLNVPETIEKSAFPAICRVTMDLLVLSYLPSAGIVPPSWKANIDCMGKLKEKIAQKTCDRL